MLRKNISAYVDDYVHLIIVCICAGTTQHFENEQYLLSRLTEHEVNEKKVERTLLHFLLIRLCLNEIVP